MVLHSKWVSVGAVRAGSTKRKVIRRARRIYDLFTKRICLVVVSSCWRSANRNVLILTQLSAGNQCGTSFTAKAFLGAGVLPRSAIMLQPIMSIQNDKGFGI